MTNSTDVFKKGFEGAIKGTTNVNSEVFREIDKIVHNLKEDNIEGGLSDDETLEDLAKKHKVKVEELKKQLSVGIKVEKKEHTKNKKTAKEIAMDHLYEDPEYYTKLKKIENNEATGTGSSGSYSAPLFGGDDDFTDKSNSETPKKVEAKEATGSGSVGAYETPATWAKSTKSKDWRGKSKTQIPGGSFVTIKKKCKSFPYCNQGDIRALKIYERKEVKTAIENVSKKLNINETVIKAIIQYELEKKRKPLK